MTHPAMCHSSSPTAGRSGTSSGPIRSDDSTTIFGFTASTPLLPRQSSSLLFVVTLHA